MTNNTDECLGHDFLPGNFFEDWGFIASPFDPKPLPPSEQGEVLLVGRAPELGMLMRRLVTPPHIAAIDGISGMGKSSLINIATFKCYQNYLSTHRGALLLPCGASFQLTRDESLEEWIDSVYIAIAKTFIDNAAQLEEVGHKLPNLGAINNVLNTPETKSREISVAGFGVGGSNSPNLGSYLKAGFRSDMKTWLKQVFPENSSGGIVCVIDNLEILEHGREARRLLEQLRDPVLNIPGIRWVFSGALGIIRVIAASPRFQGLIHDILQLGKIPDEYALEILRSRVRAFSVNEDEPPYLPLEEKEFKLIYKIFRGNIRNTIRALGRYCLWVFEMRQAPPVTPEEKAVLFGRWLWRWAEEELNYFSWRLSNAEWEVFDRVSAAGRRLSATSIIHDGELSQDVRARADFTRSLRILMAQGLLTGVTSHTDDRNYDFHLTDVGCLVDLARARNNVRDKK